MKTDTDTAYLSTLPCRRRSLTETRKFRILRAIREVAGNAMSAVTAIEFAKALGRYKEEAQRVPIAITSCGRVSGDFVSAREYEELQRLRAFERRVHRIKDLPAEIAEAIQGAKMNPADHLNALLDESQK